MVRRDSMIPNFQNVFRSPFFPLRTDSPASYEEGMPFPFILCPLPWPSLPQPIAFERLPVESRLPLCSNARESMSLGHFSLLHYQRRGPSRLPGPATGGSCVSKSQARPASPLASRVESSHQAELR